MLGGAQLVGLKGASMINAGVFGGIAGGGLAAAFMGGTVIGNWLNSNTPIQSWIASAVGAVNDAGRKRSDYDK